MATLSDRNGVKVIQFRRTGKVRTLSIGRMSKKDAQSVRTHIEHLIASKRSGQPMPADTAGWIGRIDDDLHNRIVKLGLADPRNVAELWRVKSFCDAFAKRREGDKPRTRINLQQAAREIVAYFGADKSMDSFTKADAQDYKRHLDSKYAPSTVTGWVKKARQIFADAVDRKLILENPFVKLKLSPQVNADRNQYVPAADVLKVIDGCPDHEWKLAFALARFAGLRVPSEIRGLKWSSIFWDRDRMRVDSPKTEHHAGKDHRIVPISPMLMPYLRNALERAEDGAVYVIARLRGDNLATTGRKWIERAGLTPWPRTWQNLRASCETDWATRHPRHGACQWIGNSQAVAVKHYTQVTDEHFGAESALRPALCPTGDNGGLTGPQNAKTPEKPGFRKEQYPQGESNPCSSAENRLS